MKFSMKNTEIVDANYLLRYLLQDIESQYKLAKVVIENKEIFIPDIILAEVVYVLEKLYKVPRKEIANTLKDLINYKNVSVAAKNIISESLDAYAILKFDYADCLLIAYFKIYNLNVFTFDKKLQKLFL